VNAITTHVLDTTRGRPVAALAVQLARREDGGWRTVAEAATDRDGRIRDWPDADPPGPGDYRLTFATGDHFAEAFYPEVSVVFTVSDPGEHHHVPLLLSPFGYTTYRGT
jgi:5-hydroxyisourate hydrolase